MFIGEEFEDDDVPQEEDSRRSRRRDRRRKNRKKKVSYADAARPKDDDDSAKIPGVDLNKSNPTGVDEKLLCVHCGSNDHDLPDCHLITDEELGQILGSTQMTGGYASDRVLVSYEEHPACP